MSVASYFLPEFPTAPEDLKKYAEDPKWTLSNERVFMEDLVYKRFTLFSAIIVALLTGAINLRSDLLISVALLTFGTALCWMLQQAISRAQSKLDLILAILFSSKDHPTGYINSLIKDAGRVGLVGHVVPKAICILLTLLTLVEAFYLIVSLDRLDMFRA